MQIYVKELVLYGVIPGLDKLGVLLFNLNKYFLYSKNFPFLYNNLYISDYKSPIETEKFSELVDFVYLNFLYYYIVRVVIYYMRYIFDLFIIININFGKNLYYKFFIEPCRNKYRKFKHMLCFLFVDLDLIEKDMILIKFGQKILQVSYYLTLIYLIIFLFIFTLRLIILICFMLYNLISFILKKLFYYNEQEEDNDNKKVK